MEFLSQGFHFFCCREAIFLLKQIEMEMKIEIEMEIEMENKTKQKQKMVANLIIILLNNRFSTIFIGYFHPVLMFPVNLLALGDNLFVWLLNLEKKEEEEEKKENMSKIGFSKYCLKFSKYCLKKLMVNNFANIAWNLIFEKEKEKKRKRRQRLSNNSNKNKRCLQNHSLESTS